MENEAQPNAGAELVIPVETYRRDTCSLRDQFAMAALTGLVSNTLIAEHAAKAQLDGEEFPSWVAQRAYQYADAMLEARKARNAA
jgi:hypothetical protein